MFNLKNSLVAFFIPAVISAAVVVSCKPGSSCEKSQPMLVINKHPVLNILKEQIVALCIG